MSEQVELDEQAVDDALEALESGMRSAKRTMSHEKVRPSAALTADKVKEAYNVLVGAHPNYELVEGDE